jgi:hypothetical protein
MIPRPTVKQIFDQLNRMLAERVAQGNVIEHNLEKGLGAERALRSLLEEFLPLRFGVAKGKVINFAGNMSRQCDVIIYDRLNCPKLFIDENGNQILPIEGVYAILEVKTTLTKHSLTEAFENLNSVYSLQPERPVRSSNPKIDARPPYLHIVGFHGIKLPTLEAHFRSLSKIYKVNASASTYSKESPSYEGVAGDTFLVHSVACLESGTVFHTLSGKVKCAEWGAYTLGLMLTWMLKRIEEISTAQINIFDYFNYHMVEEPNFFEDHMTVNAAPPPCPHCGSARSPFIRTRPAVSKPASGE